MGPILFTADCPWVPFQSLGNYQHAQYNREVQLVYIARSTLLLDDLVPRIGALIIRMLNQGADRCKILHQCRKAIRNHSQMFDKFATRSEIIIEKILQKLG